MPSDSDEITILAFGSAAALLGWARRSLPVSQGVTLADVIGQLERECPSLRERGQRVRYAVNERLTELGAVLRAGDELAIIPPVSGG